MFSLKTSYSKIYSIAPPKEKELDELALKKES